MASQYRKLPVEDGGAPGTVDSFNGRTGVVVSQSGDYTASQITNVPAGNISATDVQAALNELDSEKGTVTSVALAAPASILTVSGSPVTTAGTLTLSLATQTANTVWAGPTSGGAATPTFRSLVTADLPAGTGTVTSVAASVPAFLSISGSPITTSGTLAITLSGTALPVANGGTGQTTANAAFNALSPMTTGGDLIYGGASGVATRLANGTAGQVLTSSGTTVAPTWASPTGNIATTTKTANYTIAIGDHIIFADSSGGAFNLTLPSPSTVTGHEFIIKDSTGSFGTNNVTLVRFASEKIEGLAASRVLTANWGCYRVFSNGTDWFLG